MTKAQVLRANPKLCVLAQYTRHVRPGMAILETGDPGVVAAYDRRAGRLAIVATGGREPSERTFDLSRFRLEGRSASRWTTEPQGAARHEKGPDLRFEGDALTVPLPANSVQTLELSGVGPR